MNNNRIRIIHFVTGGGSGATRVALDLALAQIDDPDFQPYLILRDKGRPLPLPMQDQIRKSGLCINWVSNRWPRWFVVREIAAFCKRIAPAAFFAHGYSEHLWGRQAAFAAGVPVVIHVEHNIERYWPWRAAAARKWAPRTSATLCVSTAVADNVLRLGIGSRRVEVLHNGVDLTRFDCNTPLSQRSPDILVPARFARNKDQMTLIRAAKLLVDRGWEGQMLLAGGGKAAHRRCCEAAVSVLGLQERVRFLGNVDDLPKRFAQCRIAALASWQEGLPLVLAESMAAGCAVVASRTPGITDIVLEGVNGWLFPPGDARSAANALWDALKNDEEAKRRADAGREEARNFFSLAAMALRYKELLRSLLPSAR